LIDAGTQTGLPFSGSAPDLGAFEKSVAAPQVNQLPVISISSPAANTSFIAPATITIEASANDPDGTIIKVEFFKGSIKIGEKTTGPFSYSWTEINEGSYTLTAVATDNLNAKTVSAAVTVNVNKPVSAANQLPVISISSPTKGNSFSSPASLIIEADAFDPDGTIEKVELFNGNVKMGEITAAPYLFTLKDLTVGDYSLTAVATDNLKATSTSELLALKVTSYNENKEFFNLYPNPNEGQFQIDFSTPFDAQYYTVSVINVVGNTVYKENLQKEDLPKHFDLSSLKPGIYIVMISGDAIVTTQKFIKN
jgi:hypothetical protein